MSPRSRGIAAAVGAASLLGVITMLAFDSRGAPGPAGSASGAPTALVSAPLLAGSSVPLDATPSAEPQAAEWESAPTFRPTIDRTRGRFAGRCALRVIREWIRLSCHGYYAIELVAGGAPESKVWTGRDNTAATDLYNTRDLTVARAIATFRLRRGESQIVTLFGILRSDYGMWPKAHDTVQVSWREGEADPHIVVTPEMLDVEVE